MMTAVTGGTGFIGQHLVRSLLSDGEKLRLLVRTSSRLPGLAKSPLEIVRADLLDQASLKKALDGCRRLYHLAAHTRNWSPEDEAFNKINVEGFGMFWKQPWPPVWREWSMSALLWSAVPQIPGRLQKIETATTSLTSLPTKPAKLQPKNCSCLPTSGAWK